MKRSATAPHYVIDDLAKVLRKPSAGPTITPREVIAIVLTTTHWIPDRMVGPDDRVVDAIMDTLEEAGWKFEPI
jgi:hypothetical protein